MFDKVMSELASYTGNVSDQGLTIAKKVRLCRPAVPSTLFVLMQLDRAALCNRTKTSKRSTASSLF